jgi:Fibronectin type III domain
MPDGLFSGTCAVKRLAPSSMLWSLRAVVVVVALSFAAVLGFVGPASALAPGDLSIVAGSSSQCGTVLNPGAATDSSLCIPYAIALDSQGNLYIADTSHYLIEKVTPAGTLSILAGGGQSTPTTTAQQATNVQLGYIEGIAVDAAGNVYLADATLMDVEEVTPSGALSVIAGTGISGPPSPGQPATSSSLSIPDGLALDAAGNLYVADENNGLVEKIDTTGVVSIFAGGGANPPSTTAQPATSVVLRSPVGIAVDASGNVFLSDAGQSEIVEISASGELSVIAGGGSTIPGANPMPATEAAMNFPRGVALDAAGNLYVADTYYELVEKVSPTGTLSIFAGTGGAGLPTPNRPATSSMLRFPMSVASDAVGNVFIADAFNDYIEEVATTDTAPAAPTGVSARAGSSSAAVSWSAPASDGGLPVTGYAVEYSSDGGTTWTSATMCSGTATTCTVTGLTPGKTYVFRVAATNLMGTGAYSTPSPPVTPPAPTTTTRHVTTTSAHGSTTTTTTAAAEKVLATTGWGLVPLLVGSGLLLVGGGIIAEATRRRRNRVV